SKKGFRENRKIDSDSFIYHCIYIHIDNDRDCFYTIIGNNRIFQTYSDVGFLYWNSASALSQDEKFGILPLLAGTVTSSVIAMLIATPIGLMSAIYLSEYASERVKRILKPLLELLAGIPTIVYGFFAFTFVTPLLREIIPSLEPTNILSPGIVMGVMIIPMVASMSEDAMNAVD